MSLVGGRSKTRWIKSNSLIYLCFLKVPIFLSFSLSASNYCQLYQLVRRLEATKKIIQRIHNRPQQQTVTAANTEKNVTRKLENYSYRSSNQMSIKYQHFFRYSIITHKKKIAVPKNIPRIVVFVVISCTSTLKHWEREWEGK